MYFFICIFSRKENIRHRICYVMCVWCHIPPTQLKETLGAVLVAVRCHMNVYYSCILLKRDPGTHVHRISYMYPRVPFQQDTVIVVPDM